MTASGFWYTFGTAAVLLCVVLGTPREAEACSCVDFTRLAPAEAQQYVLDDWARADAAVLGTVASRSTDNTVVTLRRVLKGQGLTKPLLLFRRTALEYGVPDCRPTLSPDTRYLILLFKQKGGGLEGEGCGVWSGQAKDRFLGWVDPTPRN